MCVALATLLLVLAAWLRQRPQLDRTARAALTRGGTRKTRLPSAT